VAYSAQPVAPRSNQALALVLVHGAAAPADGPLAVKLVRSAVSAGTQVRLAGSGLAEKGPAAAAP
jgi:hypothetical protein